ncbi:uncharacterized protein LOC126758758 isoform X1 [Bactrocera neohumeralis]|uniref:uncharacterized protein LOC126758758 isoform X1 n=1 Tax=Bactrocera neohumeralis TaxID=98809 RepID=UPI00216669AD|nr:uncharacterized protein LOC126758758 isoform X1 [Bactrocera neohumeralis]
MPGNSCSVCKSSWNNAVSMFSPPRDEYMRSKWEVAIGVKLTQSSRLCSKHFCANDFTSANPKRARLQSDAVPSLNLSGAGVERSEPQECLSAIDSYRKNRASMEQLLFFVNFANKHPKILTSKFGTVSHLWEGLARNLNSMDGACRSADKWKESMSTWRSQLRCRARRGKSSGVPQFDEFALLNFGQRSLNEEVNLAINSTNNDAVAEGVGAKNMVNKADNIKGVLKTELIKIKKEIDSSEDDHSRQEDSQAEVAHSFEETLDTKHDIVLSEDSNPTYEANHSNTEDIPALGFPDTSRSEIFVIPRQKVTKETEKAKIFIIPRTSTENNTPTTTDNVQRKIIQLGQSSVSKNTEGSSQGIIILPPHSNTSNISSSLEVLPSLENKHTSATQSVAGNTTNAPKKRKSATLSDMYETLLESMKRRDQREEQFITVMQGLTDAVTKMADNVKRLEEVLTFCANDS